MNDIAKSKSYQKDIEISQTIMCGIKNILRLAFEMKIITKHCNLKLNEQCCFSKIY